MLQLTEKRTRGGYRRRGEMWTIRGMESILIKYYTSNTKSYAASRTGTGPVCG